MSLNFPDNARRVIFKPLAGKTVKYWIWEKGGKWYWFTQGNSGEEATQELAMAYAREYIIMGVHGLKSHGEYHGVLNAVGQQGGEG